jgi:hypothetical protein
LTPVDCAELGFIAVDSADGDVAMGAGHGGIGVVGDILIVFVVLLLTGRL